MIKIRKIIEVPEIQEALVVVGMPGIGLVGKNAIAEMSDQSKAERWAEIYFEDFPSQTLIEKTGQMIIPSAQVYYKRLESGVGQVSDLILLTADFQPMNPAGIYIFAEEFCKFLVENVKKAAMVVATGALVPDHIPDEANVHVSGTHLDIIDSFVQMESGLCQVMDGGYISGCNGIIPAWAGVHYEIPGISLLAETVPMLKVDPRASRSIIIALNERFGLAIPTDHISKEVEEMETLLQSIQNKSFREDDEDNRSQSYIG